MRKNIQALILSFLFLIILTNLVVGVTVVTVPPAEQPQPTAPVSHWYDFISSPIFWTVVAIFVVVVIFLVIIFFVVKWLVKYIQQRNDIFWRMRAERMQMAKIHGRYPANHWLKVSKNPPIRLLKKNEHDEVFLTDPIGYYRGDFIGHEGNLCIAMNLLSKKKWFLFPVRDLLIVPNKEKIKIIGRNENGVKIREDEYTLPTAKDIIQWNKNEIIIKAENLSQVGVFLIPVLKSADGKHIDLSLPAYATLKDVIIGDYLYEQSQDYVVGMRKAVDFNPFGRHYTKMADSGNNVEVASSNQGTQ